jgi:hypothetical protein
MDWGRGDNKLVQKVNNIRMYPRTKTIKKIVEANLENIARNENVDEKDEQNACILVGKTRKKIIESVN